MKQMHREHEILEELIIQIKCSQYTAESWIRMGAVNPRELRKYAL
jgi:hypothetical protein